MKRITLFVLLAVALAYGGTTHLSHMKSATTGLDTISITGAATVYTQVFNADPTMTIKHIAWDSTGADSVDLTIVFQTPSVVMGVQQWTDDRTTTIAVDSTGVQWHITSSTISVTRYARLKITGGSDNCKLTPVQYKADLWGWTQ